MMEIDPSARDIVLHKQHTLCPSMVVSVPYDRISAIFQHCSVDGRFERGFDQILNKLDIIDLPPL